MLKAGKCTNSQVNNEITHKLKLIPTNQQQNVVKMSQQTTKVACGRWDVDWTSDDSPKILLPGTSKWI